MARNAPCSCGSGRRYQHCCLAAEKRAAGATRFDEAVGNRIQGSAAETLGKDVGVALEEYVGPERTMYDEDVQIFSSWSHNDREFPSGETLAAANPALTRHGCVSSSRSTTNSPRKRQAERLDADDRRRHR